MTSRHKHFEPENVSLAEYRDLIDMVLSQVSTYGQCVNDAEREQTVKRMRDNHGRLVVVVCGRASELDKMRADAAIRQARVCIGNHP